MTSHRYDGYGTSTDGAVCRTVVFFKSDSGNRIEGIVNPNGSLENIVSTSSEPAGSTPPHTQIGSTKTAPNWSGYELDCAHDYGGTIGVVGCNPDLTNEIRGGTISFTLPTASTPTGVGINGPNGGNCCWMSEWVGAGDSEPSSTNYLIQAGIDKGTNNFASQNNVAWYDIFNIGYLPDATINFSCLDCNDHIAWPCPGGPADGDTINVIVNETTIDYGSNQTSIDFQWTDFNHGSLKCQFDYGRLISGEYPLSWAYYVVEANRFVDANRLKSCVFGPIGTPPQHPNFCELPAWGDPIRESGYLITWSSQGPVSYSTQTLPIDQVPRSTINESVLSQCANGAANVATSALNGNSWTSAWLTSAQEGAGQLNECDQKFTLAPYPGSLLLSGSFKLSFITVNSVGDCECNGNNVVFTTAISPSSGLTVACPNFTVSTIVNPGYAQCNFTASTPGIYNVIINGTITYLTTYLTNMTVVVASVPVNYASPYSIGGVTVQLQGGFYPNNGVFVGSTGLTATDSSGNVIFSKTGPMTLSTLRFVEEIPTRPYWLSVDCLPGGSGVTCSLTRTLDINHDAAMNIEDLASLAACFGQGVQCGATNLTYPSLCPQCSTTTDVTGSGGPPDGIVNIFDLMDEALFFSAAVIPP